MSPDLSVGSKRGRYILSVHTTLAGKESKKALRRARHLVKGGFHFFSQCIGIQQVDCVMIVYLQDKRRDSEQNIDGI